MFMQKTNLGHKASLKMASGKVRCQLASLHDASLRNLAYVEMGKRALNGTFNIFENYTEKTLKRLAQILRKFENELADNSQV